MQAYNQRIPNLRTVEDIFVLAKQHPFYRERMGSAMEFAQAPVTDKKTLYAAINHALANEGNHFRSVYWSPSGGSVAEYMLFYPTNIEENHIQRALLAQPLKEEGILTADTVALNVFGSTLMYRSLEIFNQYCDAAGATSLPVSSVCSDELACKIAAKFGANTIMGLPSRILQLARYVVRENKQLKFDKVIFAGEPLAAHKEDYLTRVFGVEHFYGLYGSAEAGVWAYQTTDPGCPQGGYLFPQGLMHVEILNPDQDGFGNIVTTNLLRTSHPLLRYDSGDVGRLMVVSLSGRQRTVLELRGRTERSFEIAGEYYALDDFSELFGQFEVLEYQIVLSFDAAKKMDVLSFHLVLEPSTPGQVEKTKGLLTEGVRRIVQSNDNSFITNVDLVELESLQRSKTSQKVLKIVDERPN